VQIKPSKLRGLIIAVITTLALTAGLRPTLAAENGEPVAKHSRALIFGTPGQFREALTALTARGRPDVIPSPAIAPTAGSTGWSGRSSIPKSRLMPATPS
jgi:hypothetical protein